MPDNNHRGLHCIKKPSHRIEQKFRKAKWGQDQTHYVHDFGEGTLVKRWHEIYPRWGML